MRELDVSSLNKKSPYAVEMRSERDYVFHTDHGVTCVVKFKTSIYVLKKEEGVMNFAAIIVQKSNPCLETIIADFRSAIDELQKPN